MTLHKAIEKLLLQHAKPMTTVDIANELNKNKWYKKKDGSLIQPFQIHGRTRNYPHLFNRSGSIVFLKEQRNNAVLTINKQVEKSKLRLSEISKDTEDLEKELINERSFKNISNLDEELLDSIGFYCIRLKDNSKLTGRYQNILDKRKFKLIYIGVAEKQSLKKRLRQELKHEGPGTFFRSIGCVLRYTPIKGHLIGRSNQNNFKFSTEDTAKIIKWLQKNVELSIVKFGGDFNIEKDFIKKYCPLLNNSHNPKRLRELKEDKEICRKIARNY